MGVVAVLDCSRRSGLCPVGVVELSRGGQRGLIGRLLQLSVHCCEACIIEGDSAHSDEREQRHGGEWRNCGAITPPKVASQSPHAFGSYCGPPPPPPTPCVVLRPLLF